MTFKLVIAGTVLLAAGAVQARTPVATVPQSVAPDTSAKPKAAAAKRYCVQTTITGSRMPQKVCRTRKDWMATGFDPLAPND